MSADKRDQGEQPNPPFKVSDRRSFAGTGDDAPAEGEAGMPSLDLPSGAKSPEEDGSGTLPGVDFHTFILSLGSSALLHLGELDQPDQPDGQGAKADLPLAKQTIDMISMLQEKTRGNLTPPEARLIESLLYDLRLRFVELNKK